jgi:hypothetical protein
MSQADIRFITPEARPPSVTAVTRSRDLSIVGDRLRGIAAILMNTATDTDTPPHLQDALLVLHDSLQGLAVEVGNGC